MKVYGLVRLVTDPEQASANAPVKFRVADNFYNSKTKSRDSQFFSCHAWGKTGELLKQYVGKGQQVLIAGKLINEEYTNKNGETVRTTTIDVTDVDLVSNKGGQQATQSTTPNTNSW